MSVFLLTNYSFSELSCMLICLVLTLYIFLQPRTERSINLGLSFLFSFLFHLGYFISFSFFTPAGSAGWLLAAFSSPGIVFLLKFAYSHPDTMYPREKKFVTALAGLVTVLLALEYLVRVLRSDVFGASLFYGTENASVLLSFVVVIINVQIILVALRQARHINAYTAGKSLLQTLLHPSNHDARSVRNFSLIASAHLLNTILLSFQLASQQINRVGNNFMISSLFVIIYVMFMINYIGSSVHRIPLLHKVAGLFLCGFVVMVNITAWPQYRNLALSFDREQMAAARQVYLFHEQNPGLPLPPHPFSLFYLGGNDDGAPRVLAGTLTSDIDSLPCWQDMPGLRQIIRGLGARPLGSINTEGRYFCQINGENTLLYFFRQNGTTVFAGVPLALYRAEAHTLSMQLVCMLLAALAMGIVIFPLLFRSTFRKETCDERSSGSAPDNRAEPRTINTLDDELVLLREDRDQYRASYTIQPDVAEKLDRAVEYIYCNYNEDISRENLATHVGLSPSYFGRLFKIHTGRKFGDYINDLRVRKAAELLRSTDRVIIEIAFETGFESLRTFNRVFMNTTGKTPSEYREM